MAYQKLGRDSSARKALFRDLVTDLFLYERIQTTEAKAKEVRSIAEKLITLAKRGDLHARRQAAAFVRRETSGRRTGRHPEAVLRSGHPLCGTSGRIHPHFEAGTPPRRFSSDGVSGTGGSP